MPRKLVIIGYFLIGMLGGMFGMHVWQAIQVACAA